jgi:hypothetical protein
MSHLSISRCELVAHATLPLGESGVAGVSKVYVRSILGDRRAAVDGAKTPKGRKAFTRAGARPLAKRLPGPGGPSI